MMKNLIYKLLLLSVFVFLFPVDTIGVTVIDNDKSKQDTGAVSLNMAQMGEKILDFVTWERGDFIFTVYPSLGANPRSGFVYGIMPAIKWNSSRPGKVNTFTLNAEASTKGMMQLQLEHELYFNKLWMTSGEAMINRREDQFWLGNDEEGHYFDREEININWDVLRNVTSTLWVGADFLFARNDFDDISDEVVVNSIADETEGSVLVGSGPKIVFDSRHRSLSPQRGLWVELLPFFAGIGGAGDYRYNRITLDARRYLQLREGKSTLAFQGLLDYADTGVPFYEAPQLGGKERLRGIGHPLRKTGNAVWFARGELRQHLWWRFGGVLFAGFGQAADHYQLPFSDALGSFGGGLRFRMLPDDPLNVRVDVGVSTIGTTGFFISLKEAF